MTFQLKGKSIWIAGHTGMVGSALSRQLAGADCRLITIGRNNLDLTRQQAVEDFVAREKPDVIIVAAARVGGIYANSHFPAEFLYENLAISQNIIEAAHRHDCQKLVYLGSACMYPRDVDQPIKEMDLLSGAPEPTNEAYAMAKIAGTKLCQYYSQQYGRAFITVVPTNSYGPFDNFDPKTSHVPAALMMKFHQAKLEQSAQVVLWGSGTPLRDFIFVDDMAKAILFAAENYDAPEPLNIGTGREFSILQLAETMKEVVGFDGEIVHDTSKPDGAPRKLMDCSRLMKLGWHPTYNLQQGLEKTYKWFLGQQDGLSARPGSHENT